MKPKIIIGSILAKIRQFFTWDFKHQEYERIGHIISNKFKEREQKLMKRPDAKFARGWAWASDLNKCLGILHDLQELKNLNKYQQWFLKEIKSLLPNVKYLDEFHKWIQLGTNGIEFVKKKKGKFDFDNLDDLREFDDWTSREGRKIEVEPKDLMVSDLNFDDEFGLRVCLCSATIAYCAQFGLEDFEVFYNIYKEVLRIKGLDCLVPL